MNRVISEKYLEKSNWTVVIVQTKKNVQGNIFGLEGLETYVLDTPLIHFIYESDIPANVLSELATTEVPWTPSRSMDEERKKLHLVQ